jgi:hypothetical protein
VTFERHLHEFATTRRVIRGRCGLGSGRGIGATIGRVRGGGRSRSRIGGLVALVALAACNLVSGASDLEIGGESTPLANDAGARDVTTADRTTLPPVDGSVADASVDATTDASKSCAALTATSLLGNATGLGTSYFQLTPEQNNLAGGIHATTPASLDDFDASFGYSMTYTSASAPAAGVAFYAIESQPMKLGCQSGPYLCTLGANGPGFAVILRTSKAAAADPDVPYVAVVDAQAYPSTAPATPIPILADKAWTLVGAQGSTPPATSFHTMAIAMRSGTIGVAIDGVDVLKQAVPGWKAGRLYTWGLGASTGVLSSFATRTVVTPVTFTRCQ